MWPDKAGFSPLLIYSAAGIDVVKPTTSGQKRLNKHNLFDICQTWK
jgi:hypothetical protein